MPKEIHESLLDLLEHECMLAYMRRQTDWVTTTEACAAVYDLYPQTHLI